MSLTDASPTVAAKAAKAASHILATLTVEARNDALTLMHDALAESKDVVLAANSEDVELARKEVAAGRLGSALVDRLDLNRKGKWDDMLTGILNVRALPDPLGIITVRTRLDDGLDLERISCPIGVLLVIFEARPEVLANIAALAVKSGNAALLKGGKESTRTMVAMAAALTKALAKSVVPAAAVQLVTGRESVTELLALDRDIDLVVPRGSNELVRSIKAGTRIPVLGHADGLCSIYVDAGLRTQHDAEMVTNVLVDAKTGYPAACNSMETLLVHEDALQEPAFRTAVAGLLGAGVTLHCDPTTREVVKEIVAGLGEQKDKQVRVATAADFDTEFLSLDLAVKVVPSLEAAVVHINEHGSHHTDAILTASREHAEHFMAAVDSAGVYWNASTRFADGMRYGFGTEVGISTNKIHSRGPVGLEGLTIYKYKLRGTGQTASEYGKGLKLFKHEPLPLL